MKVNSPLYYKLKLLFDGNLQYGFLFILILIIILVSAAALYLKIEKKLFADIGQENDEGTYHSVQLEVLNGCGVSGLAERFTEFLRRNKFDVVNTGNYKTFDIDYSLVIDRTGEYKKAELIAEALGIDDENIFSLINESYFLDVTLVIGNDFQQLKPFQK